jgi:hypothetical protein
MTTTLIAIDPGKLTGYAVFDTSDGESPRLVRSLELTPEMFYDELREELRRHKAADVHIVFEEFKITVQTGKNSDAPWSLENIGVIKFLCYVECVAWSMQSPAAAKTFATNERLQKLEFWHAGGHGHANDAIRHGVLYMVQSMRWRSPDLLI